MMRKALLAVLLVAATQAQAAYECSVKPQDDVVITPQSVQVVGTNGNLQISPQGDVQFNGQKSNNCASVRGLRHRFIYSDRQPNLCADLLTK